jgi:DNA-directed RNA polymerase subunit RPC12/RpoP
MLENIGEGRISTLTDIGGALRFEKEMCEELVLRKKELTKRGIPFVEMYQGCKFLLLSSRYTPPPESQQSHNIQGTSQGTGESTWDAPISEAPAMENKTIVCPDCHKQFNVTISNYPTNFSCPKCGKKGMFQ